jgi:hypothetical protein
MRRFDKTLLWAAFGALALASTVNVFAQTSQQAANAPLVQQIAAAELPDSPGAVQTQMQDAVQQQNGSSKSSITLATQDQSQSQSQPALPAQTQPNPPPESKPQRPVGTAAAEAPMVSGTTAAQPAGVAIAPAKQHRVRTIILRTGAIIGAGVALGATIALTEGTSSKPPGAH